jgi:hypothetical protein
MLEVEAKDPKEAEKLLRETFTSTWEKPAKVVSFSWIDVFEKGSKEAEELEKIYRVLAYSGLRKKILEIVG